MLARKLQTKVVKGEMTKTQAIEELASALLDAWKDRPDGLFYPNKKACAIMNAEDIMRHLNDEQVRL